jgi:two-component system, LuxR family, sensor kinase FixL
MFTSQSNASCQVTDTHRIQPSLQANSMNDGSLESVSFPSFPEIEALLRLQNQLLNVSRLATVGEMSSGIAHELNQPLCAVANYAQACDRLLSLPNPDIAEIRDSLQQITSQALRAGDVIQRLRSLARPQQALPELLDINTVVLELSDLIQSDARHHQIRFRQELAGGLPQVRADKPQIQQLILNLVRNAIEAQADIPAEQREVTVRTTLTGNADVEISVWDRGPGVSTSIAPHLFDPFCTTKSAGTGLGLAMSRTIARANAGTLEYRPNSPAGACFALTLPSAATPEAATHCG